jgi:hypothetical protein
VQKHTQHRESAKPNKAREKDFHGSTLFAKGKRAIDAQEAINLASVFCVSFRFNPGPLAKNLFCFLFGTKKKAFIWCVSSSHVSPHKKGKTFAD